MRRYVAFLSLTLVGSYTDQLVAITIETDTVYDQSCPDGSPCGEQLIVVDGDDPPTVLEIVEPATLVPIDSPAVGLRGSSILNMTGGHISSYENQGQAVLASEKSTVNISGGEIIGVNGILGVGQSRINVLAGRINTEEDGSAVELAEEATGEISGGESNGLVVRGHGHLTVTRGSVNGKVIVDENGVLDVLGGSIREAEIPSRLFTVKGQGTLNVFSGSMSVREVQTGLEVQDSGTANIFGGSFKHPRQEEPDFAFTLRTSGLGHINLHGSDWSLNGDRLSGVLADGSAAEFLVFGDGIELHGLALVAQPGDANQDLAFDQRDIVHVLQGAKYLTSQPATWGEGDWNGAPGGSPRNPPQGNGLFDQFDIIAALQSGTYLTGPYVALKPSGKPSDAQASIVYDASTGEVAVDAPAAVELTSVNIDSATGIFTNAAAQNLGGSFDNDADDNIFKATFGSSFGSISFGNVAQPGLAEDFLAADLTVVGSLQGGGALGDVDLVYIPVPEPAGVALGASALALSLAMAWHRTTRTSLK